MSKRGIDMAGRRYGTLVGVAPAGKTEGSRNIIWQFSCDCGRTCETDGYSVRSGKISSCSICGAERGRIASIKHGLSDSAEFKIWIGMLTRCLNSNAESFKYYGARGITVCDRWRDSFESFLADMGPRPTPSHSIERNDNDGNYEPANCEWATARKQSRNKRNTVRIEISGTTKTLQDWADQSGVAANTIRLRLKAGVSGEALLTPSRSGGTLTFQGVTATYAEWSKRTGIKESTIAMRLSARKWPIERALTVGARQC